MKWIKFKATLLNTQPPLGPPLGFFGSLSFFAVKKYKKYNLNCDAYDAKLGAAETCGKKSSQTDKLKVHWPYAGPVGPEMG